ncbi:MAG: molybdopterin-dependent oxidoreductase [Thermodesulfobacteriota bacterium]
MRINRRDFLKMGGGAGVAIALGGGFWKWSQFPPVERPNPPGVEKWVPTACGQCMGGCGILVRVIDGWATNIIGNPLHPVNRGTLCPKGIAGLQGLYDPDRIRSPLRRGGKRGEGRWQPVSWEEALHLITEALKDLRQKGEPHHLVVLGGRYRGLMRSLWERFLEAFGSPNYIDNQFQWEGSPVEGFFLTQGIYSMPAYDFENTQYILSFGSGLLESYWSPVQALRAYGHFRRGKPGQRGKLVQIESRLSVTGIKADEWIPIRPGTEGIMALGIAHMMVKEDLYNKEFISNHTFGFENWADSHGREHLGFKELVLSEYEPQLVSKQTGAPVDIIIRLAREFALNQPSLTIGYRDRPFHQMAVAVLNGLVGNIDTFGGVLIPRTIPYQSFPPFKRDTVAQRGYEKERVDEGKGPLAIHRPHIFAQNTLSGRPYKPKVLFLYYTNPSFSNPTPDLFSKALAEIPFIVSFSPYMDDSSQFADLVLPDHTPLERWQDDPLFLNNGYSVLGIRQPIIDPLYQTKSTGDVLLQIAKSLGGEVRKALPWNDFKEILIYSLKGVFEAKRGDIFGLQFDEAWTRLLQKGGWWDPSYKTFEEFWKLLQEKGGWWDPIYDFGERDRIFKTPSKKFEFYAQGLKERDLKDSSLLPHWEEPKKAADEKEYPLRLHIFRTITLTGGRNANQPWLHEIVGPHLFERWKTWVEINPETAKRLGVSDGDWVWVESPHGKIKVKTRLYKGAMPEVVNIPFGLGHRSGGRWAAGLGTNPYRLLPNDLDPLTGQPIHGTARVKVYKA